MDEGKDNGTGWQQDGSMVRCPRGFEGFVSSPRVRCATLGIALRDDAAAAAAFTRESGPSENLPSCTGFTFPHGI